MSSVACRGRGDGMSTKTTMNLQDRLRREITGEVLFDRFSRGRYATDASFYQIMPLGVVVPRTMDEALRSLAIARPLLEVELDDELTPAPVFRP